MQCLSIGSRDECFSSEKSLIDCIICAVGYTVISLSGREKRKKQPLFPKFLFMWCISIQNLFANRWQIHGCLIHLFSQTIPMAVSAFQALCCLFPSHFLLLCSDTPGSAADGARPVGVGRQPALARNFQFQLDLTEGGEPLPIHRGRQ